MIPATTLKKRTPQALKIRPEEQEDFAAVCRVHEAAFPSDAEARLVDLLRARGKAVVSLVAVWDGFIVGHILFSPVSIEAPAPDFSLKA